jgi:glycerol-3-phosphate dehydrogenase
MKGADGGAFEVVVIGGGIHGAMVCRELTARGYAVLLLEASDYSAATSSRSSKMIHGGVRYLETGDIHLVREALLERESLLRIAPHLTRVQEFLMPVIPGRTRPGWQIHLGLSLYDLLARWGAPAGGSFPKHRRRGKSAPEAQHLIELGSPLTECYSYSDGQMDDARIVIESIVAAAEGGATTFNYAKVVKLNRAGAKFQVRWRDEISGEEHGAEARFVVNAAGPWVPELHSLLGEPWQPRWPRPLYSRGTHLLFDSEWQGPGVILPTPVPGRYYFVWPLFVAGGKQTLVGTTDVELLANEGEPTPSEAEIAELLRYLQADLPRSGLTRERLYSAFSGVRILGGAPHRGSISSQSRSLALLRTEGTVSLLGGKYTSARKVGEGVANEVERFFGRKPHQLALRPLPGGEGWPGASDPLTRPLVARGASLDEAKNAVQRFGTRVHILPQLLEKEGPWTDLDLLQAQVRYTIRHEHAITVQDVLRRRLGLALLPGGGKELEGMIEKEIQQLSR